MHTERTAGSKKARINSRVGSVVSDNKGLAKVVSVLRQIRWCAAIQTLVNCHCQLEENPVGNVEPMQLVVQYLIQAAIKISLRAAPAETL